MLLLHRVPIKLLNDIKFLIKSKNTTNFNIKDIKFKKSQNEPDKHMFVGKVTLTEALKP